MVVCPPVATEVRTVDSGGQIHRASCLPYFDALRRWQVVALRSWSKTSIPLNKARQGFFERVESGLPPLDVVPHPSVAALSWGEPRAAAGMTTTHPPNKAHALYAFNSYLFRPPLLARGSSLDRDGGLQLLQQLMKDVLALSGFAGRCYCFFLLEAMVAWKGTEVLQRWADTEKPRKFVLRDLVLPSDGLFCRSYPWPKWPHPSTSMAEASFGTCRWGSAPLCSQVVRPRERFGDRWHAFLAGNVSPLSSVTDLDGDALRSPAMSGEDPLGLDCFFHLFSRVLFANFEPLSIRFFSAVDVFEGLDVNCTRLVN